MPPEPTGLPVELGMNVPMPDTHWRSGLQRTGRFAVVEDLDAVGLAGARALLRSRGLVGLFAQKADDLRRFEVSLTPELPDVQSRSWSLFEKVWDRAGGPDHEPVSGTTSLDRGRFTNLRWVDGSSSSPALTQQARALMQACGVDPPDDDMWSGGPEQGLALWAVDETHGVVATGTVLRVHHPQGPWRDRAQLGTVAVAPDWRGSGLGGSLALRLVLAARSQLPVSGLTAVAGDDNPASQSLLQRLGFVHVQNRVCRVYSLGGVFVTR